MKKNNKGFTLTELIAIIVILALIALISVPIITSLIKNSKIASAEKAVDGLIRAVDVYYGRRIIEDDGVFNNNQTLRIAFGSSYDEDEVGLVNGDREVEYSGSEITAGIITLDRNKRIEIVEPLRVNNYYCIRDSKNEPKCSETDPTK